MRHLTKLFLFCVLISGLNAQEVVHYLSTGNPFPVWIKCTITNSSTNLVVSGTGCTAATIAKAAALTQSIPLFQLPAGGYVHSFRIKSATAFAGTTTLLAGLGTASTPNLFLVSAVTGYDLNAAVTNTNLTLALPLVVGSDTAAAVNVVALLTSTVSNISSISAGSVDVSVLWSKLP